MASTTGARSSLAVGATRSPLPPGALFVDGNYRYQFNAWCSVAGVTLALRSRFVRADDRQLVDSGDVLAPTGDRQLSTTAIPLGVGYPLNVDLFALTGTPTVGQCFVQVQLLRGDGPAATVVGTVLQGYVTTTQALAWPGSPITNSYDGAGAVRSVTLGAPAPGGDWATLVPSGARWIVQTVFCAFNADAVVGNRFLALIFQTAAGVIMQSPLAAAITVSQNPFITWQAGFGTQIAPASLLIAASLPVAMPLLGTTQIRSASLALDPGDHWGGAIITASEWLDV